VGTATDAAGNLRAFLLVPSGRATSTAVELRAVSVRAAPPS